MDRTSAVFTVLAVVLLGLAGAVFSQAPEAPPAVQIPVPAPASSPQPSEPAESPDTIKPDLVGPDVVDPTSTNPWDRVRDVFRPFSGPTRTVQEVVAEQQEVAAQAEEAQTRLPVLQGILISSDQDKVAILDNNLVRVGDFCDGYEVRKINKNTVVLKRDRKEFSLYVKQ